jgi:ATPase subunit of ABC transporter with duplicated ATPase domains
MKKIRFILIAVFLVSLSVLSQPAGAQDKTKEEREKELRIQEEIDAQKKAFSEQKKAQEEAQKSIQESQIEVDKAMKEAQEQVEAASKYRDLVKVYKGTGDKPYFNIEPFEGEPFMYTPGMEKFWGLSHTSEGARSSLDFSRSVKENSFSRDYVFDVEPTAKSVIMSVNGDCKSGEIRIKIVMPNGKVYSDITIDESGNLNWRKSFSISEEENKDKAGAWKFQINASKATGFFKISLQAF